jgi:hypothetical protein
MSTVIKKRDVLVSPHDITIECKGKGIRTHSTVLRRCDYFAALLDNADLDNGSDTTKIIPLPAAFGHGPREVSEFVMVLYDTLDEADAANLQASIRQENVILLAQLAHYFDAPVLQAACDTALADNHEVWFPGKLVWLSEEATKNHLLSLRKSCIIKLAADIDGAGLLEHLKEGQGMLCKDPVFMTELTIAMHERGRHKETYKPCRPCQPC